MRIESELCHLSNNKAVVLVSGWLDDKKVGSSLGEGSTVDLAEDKAISRLYKRLNITIKSDENINENNKNENTNKIKIELPNSNRPDSNKVPDEPNDWSNELMSIDSEIERLNWTREDETKFLEQNFGFHNRIQITKYNDLLLYLSKLKEIDKLSPSNLNSNNIESMIKESDIILRDLCWDHKQGREYLQKEFNVSTRKELDEIQLRSFVSKLNVIRNQHLSL